MPTVAFLGLGAIGSPMAKHLAGPDYNLAVWNRTAAKAAAFATEHQRATRQHQLRLPRAPMW